MKSLKIMHGLDFYLNIFYLLKPFEDWNYESRKQIRSWNFSGQEIKIKCKREQKRKKKIVHGAQSEAGSLEAD